MSAQPEFIKVAKKSDIPPGGTKVVKVKDREIALFHAGADYFALSNACPHRGGPLGEGDLENGVIVCPWHGWQFKINTGEFLINPSIKAACFPVKIEGDDILVGL